MLSEIMSHRNLNKVHGQSDRNASRTIEVSQYNGATPATQFLDRSRSIFR